MTERYKVETAKAVSYMPEKYDTLEFIRKDGFFAFFLYVIGAFLKCVFALLFGLSSIL